MLLFTDCFPLIGQLGYGLMFVSCDCLLTLCFYAFLEGQIRVHPLPCVSLDVHVCEWFLDVCTSQPVISRICVAL